jgi:hypothetical protein
VTEDKLADRYSRNIREVPGSNLDRVIDYTGLSPNFHYVISAILRTKLVAYVFLDNVSLLLNVHHHCKVSFSVTCASAGNVIFRSILTLKKDRILVADIFHL